MTLELVCRAEVLGGDEEGGDEEGALRRAASTTDGAATSVFGHVCRRCVCTRGPCRRRQVLLSAGRLQPGRRGPCCTTNRIGGFRPWRRVANTDCRQTGSMRRRWSRRILRKRRTRGGRRRRRSAGPNVLMHSSICLWFQPHGHICKRYHELCHELQISDLDSSELGNFQIFCKCG